jgi:hypothetical protein
MKSPIHFFVITSCLCWLLAHAYGEQLPPATTAESDAPSQLTEQSGKSLAIDQDSLSERASTRLLDAGWSIEACRAWWPVNQRRLKATAEVAPDLVEKEIRLLCQMKPKGKALRLIENHPEATGVLLLAHRRDFLAGAILDAPVPDQNMLVASYLFCTTGTEVEDWTQAVARHPGAIAFFQNRCAALPYQGLFSYLAAASTLQPEAREVYGKWLDDVLALPIIRQSDERMYSRLSFAATCGPEVRKRLQGDLAFRESFLKTIWPRFRDSMIFLTQAQGDDSQDVFLYCGGEPLIWDFFKRKNSEILFRNAGMDSVLMLEGDNALLPDLQNTASDMWTKGILDLPVLMLEYQDNAHFLALARRLQAEKEWPTLNAVCLRLKQKGQQWSAEAAYLEKLKDHVLMKEIHPKEPSIIPGAALFSLGARYLDGRRAGFGEWMGAGLDVADIALAIATLGSSKTATTGPIAVLKQTLRTASHESVEKLSERAVKDLGKNQATEWTQDLTQEALKKLPTMISKAIIKFGVVEITAPVKAGFELSRNLGLGRNLFKKLTGLEPRVFMRQDGRVFINFTNIITKPSPAAAFLTRTLENGVLVSPPVESGASETAVYFHQWKEDVSAWWVGHATGQFDENP